MVTIYKYTQYLNNNQILLYYFNIHGENKVFLTYVKLE